MCKWREENLNLKKEPERELQDKAALSKTVTRNEVKHILRNTYEIGKVKLR